MQRNLFSDVGAFIGNPKWEQFIKRENPIYSRHNDIRSDFTRDYNRILHSNSFRRLKHKTQVFFATQNDHICTRMEHVNHVASVSYTIANYLGLNTELTNAIAMGHDIGHAPFGHAGEEILKNIISKEINGTFWHERNSLRFIDSFETIQNDKGKEMNLNLTYAVRDGIICHCGEVDENAIFPRTEAIDLYKIEKASQFSPFSWEGCIVKIADKISYLGRDIEDALTLNILSLSELRKLNKLLKNTINVDLKHVNNTVLMHEFIVDLCKTSSPREGIKFSPKYYELLKQVKEFNQDYIYKHQRLETYKKYAELVITSIFQVAKDMYDGKDTLNKLKKYKRIYPILVKYLREWLLKFFDVRENDEVRKKYRAIVNKFENRIIYSILSYEDYIKGIIDFISGMTDSFAIRIFNEEIIRFL